MRRFSTCVHCGEQYDWSTEAKHRLHKRTGKPRCLRKRPDNSQHRKLVTRAVAWLRGAQKCHVVFAEPSIAVTHSVDAIGWRGAGSIVVECKVSVADLMRETHKAHVRAEATIGEVRWVLVPAAIADRVAQRFAESFPELGLLVAHDKKIEVRIKAPRCEPTAAGRRDERYLLVMAIRRHQIGVRWDGRSARFEPIQDQRVRSKARSTAPPYGSCGAGAVSVKCAK